MDQNTPREDATGAQPPADPASGDGSAWNQTEQAAQNPAQAGEAAAGSGQEATAEQAAWSADAAYQQQAAPPADATAYAAPEPQSATYSDPAAAATAEQQAYAQQQQQAYAQQQLTPDQQAYAQQQLTPDQQAYAQQQQQQQPQAYDQQAYAQQQQQYAQQGYQQTQYQQPGQPYAYAQPGQQWPGQEQYWEEGGSGYGRSFMVVLSGFILLTWGLMMGLGGALVLWLGNLDEIIGDVTLSADAQLLVTEFNEQATAFGGFLLILGLVHLIGAVGIWAHRKWGRAFGIVLGILGTIWGITILVAAVGFEALESSIDVAIQGEETSMAAGFLVLATYLLVLFAMFAGKRHFRKKGVAG